MLIALSLVGLLYAMSPSQRSNSFKSAQSGSFSDVDVQSGVPSHPIEEFYESEDGETFHDIEDEQEPEPVIVPRKRIVAAEINKEGREWTPEEIKQYQIQQKEDLEEAIERRIRFQRQAMDEYVEQTADIGGLLEVFGQRQNDRLERIQELESAAELSPAEERELIKTKRDYQDHVFKTKSDGMVALESMGNSGEQEVFLELNSKHDEVLKDTLIDMKLGNSLPVASEDNPDGLPNGVPTHFILAWPNRHMTFEQLQDRLPYGLEFAISNSLFHQMVSTKIVGMTLKNLLGYRAPLGEIPILIPPKEDKSVVMFGVRNTVGTTLLNLKNIRMVNAVLGQQRGIDENILLANGEGGPKLVTKSKHKQFRNAYQYLVNKNLPHSELIDPTTISHVHKKIPDYLATIEDDHISFQVTGLAMELICQYQVVGEAGIIANTGAVDMTGDVWMRVQDAVLFMDVKLTQNETFGHPTLQVIGEPEIRYGKLEVQFQNSKADEFFSKSVELIANKVKNIIYQTLAIIVKDRLPMTVDIVGELVNGAIRDSLNDQLAAIGVNPSYIPQLLINDLRWHVENRKILIGCNVKNVDDDTHTILLKQMYDLEHRSIDPAMRAAILDWQLNGRTRWQNPFGFVEYVGRKAGNGFERVFGL